VLQRGVEIAAALVFALLLLSSLRGSKRSAAAAAPAGDGATAGHTTARVPVGGPGEPMVDPETLARAQIEELVRSDPRRVGEILSRWAGEGAAARS